MSQEHRVCAASIISRYNAKQLTGLVLCYLPRTVLKLWFVRGELAHAADNHDRQGWEALSDASGADVSQVLEEDGTLPPERTIRMNAERLLQALKLEDGTRKTLPMFRPIPVHKRLEAKFQMMQKRVNGLRSFSTNVSEESGEPTASRARGTKPKPGMRHEKIIVEIGPLGSTWLHVGRGGALKISGSEQISTSDLMWAGQEMLGELKQLESASTQDEFTDGN